MNLLLVLQSVGRACSSPERREPAGFRTMSPKTQILVRKLINMYTTLTYQIITVICFITDSRVPIQKQQLLTILRTLRLSSCERSRWQLWGVAELLKAGYCCGDGWWMCDFTWQLELLRGVAGILYTFGLITLQLIYGPRGLTHWGWVAWQDESIM